MCNLVTLPLTLTELSNIVVFLSHFGPSGKLLCLWNTKKLTQHTHSNIPNIFDHWTDPVVHLFLGSKELHGWDENFSHSLTFPMPRTRLLAGLIRYNLNWSPLSTSSSLQIQFDRMDGCRKF